MIKLLSLRSRCVLRQQQGVCRTSPFSIRPTRSFKFAKDVVWDVN